MNALASVAFGIVSSVGACIAAASVASHVVADPKSHAFHDLAEPDLWTTNPVKVDHQRQGYERIAPLYSSYVTEAPAITTASMTAGAKPAYTGPSTARQTPQPKFSTEHLAWCAQRYRSFDPAANSYRSFSGEIRTCSSPYQQTVAEADGSVGVKVNAQAATWCAARYRSYRPEDNSYQPWDGPRRTCEAPVIIATNN
ncbi:MULTISPECIES: BA14K family protein [Rhizobium]|uniref:BA14K family protein n=1 Tax=Rhizobium TaxID=379 RepID=UPI00234ECE15|nr:MULTISPECIES: BA14K family protein [unclassified Rhizobium]MDC7745799.1 BA14K family protein [Rhizobium sp. BC56]MDC9812422.1 BA14K family protein [Rhizobium sp. MC62]MDC9835738.1 BA14K family protein [Rhizobium sp. MJ37]WEA61595.1 BA14K family protein [Rhizobium sp. BJ04]